MHYQREYDNLAGEGKRLEEKPCLISYLRESGCDTERKLRDAITVITGTLRVNPAASFRVNDGYIYHG